MPPVHDHFMPDGLGTVAHTHIQRQINRYGGGGVWPGLFLETNGQPADVEVAVPVAGRLVGKVISLLDEQPPLDQELADIMLLLAGPPLDATPLQEVADHALG